MTLLRINIEAKLMFVVIFMALLIATIIGGVSFLLTEKAMQDRVDAQLLSVSALKENELNNYINEKSSDLLTITTDDDFREYSEDMIAAHQENGSSDKDIHEEIRGKLNRYIKNRGTSFEELFIISKDGSIHISTNPENEGKIEINEECFIEGKKGLFVKNPAYSLLMQEYTLTISAPILDENMTFYGVLAGRIDMEDISNIMTQRSGLGKTGETYLVNQANYLVTKSRFQDQLEFRKAIYSDVIKDCLAGNDSIGQYRNYLDVPVIGVYRWIPERDVCLVSEMSQTEALDPMNSLALAIIIVGFVIAVIISVFIILFSRTITKPIEDLVKGTVEISKGSYGVKLKIKTGDEIEKLADAFNVMSVELEKSKKLISEHETELNSSVESKTKELHDKLDELEKTKLAIINILEDTDDSNKDLLRTRTELRDKIEKLKEVDKKKDEFVSITAHELKTPLTSIKGFTELLKNDQVISNKELRSKYFQIIIEDTERLGKLITDVLDLSRLDIGTMKFTIERTSPKEIFTELKNLVDLSVKAKKLKSIYEIDKGVHEFSTDKSRLTQVLSNLVNNAVKYTEKGYIKVSVFNKENMVHFKVADTGVGIPKEAQPRIFERFYQADSSYTRMVGGSGLGLSISKGIVESLGGKIWFKSTPGKGTIFEFTLPVDSAGKAEIPSARQNQDDDTEQ